MENTLFEKTSVPKAYLKLALPVVLSMMVSLVYNMVDTYFIALTGMKELVAGVSLVVPVFAMMIAFGDIFGIGGSSVISMLFGQKKDDEAKRASAFCVWSCVIFGICVSVILMAFRRPILGVLGADEITYKYASDYYTWIAIGATAIIFGLLVGFAFGGQPLIGYNYGSKNHKRLKEILKFAYALEMGLGLLFTLVMSVFAPQIIGVFMNEPEIIADGSMMLRFQQLGMTFMAVTLVSTCVCRSVGNALGSFILSISRQGVLYVFALFVMSHLFGYTGILVSQACADVLTAIVAVFIISRTLKKTK